MFHMDTSVQQVVFVSTFIRYNKCYLQTIATASLFLACKLKETPCLLRDVVVVAHEIMYKYDPFALKESGK